VDATIARSSILLYAIGQALVVPNWVAGLARSL
jgi:hypothetical protein